MERELSPVEPTRARSVRDGLQGGMLHVLGMAALYRFDVLLDPCGRPTRGERRHIRHLPRRGRRGAWYPGLGRMVLALLTSEAAGDVYLVPTREEHSSNVRLYRTSSGRRRARRLALRRSIRMVIGDPVPLLKSGLTPATDPRRIAATLRAGYRSARMTTRA